jgi:hypothetical protein
MKTYLQVKIASLAAEARIIRRKEYIAKDRARLCRSGMCPDNPEIYAHEAASLHQHRTFDVRRESRAAQLALGYLRGRAYRAMEAKCYEAPQWKRVAELVKKYGDRSPNADKEAIVGALLAWSEKELLAA